MEAHDEFGEEDWSDDGDDSDFPANEDKSLESRLQSAKLTIDAARKENPSQRQDPETSRPQPSAFQSSNTTPKQQKSRHPPQQRVQPLPSQSHINFPLSHRNPTKASPVQTVKVKPLPQAPKPLSRPFLSGASSGASTSTTFSQLKQIALSLQNDPSVANQLAAGAPAGSLKEQLQLMAKQASKSTPPKSNPNIKQMAKTLKKKQEMQDLIQKQVLLGKTPTRPPQGPPSEPMDEEDEDQWDEGQDEQGDWEEETEDDAGLEAPSLGNEEPSPSSSTSNTSNPPGGLKGLKDMAMLLQSDTNIMKQLESTDGGSLSEKLKKVAKYMDKKKQGTGGRSELIKGMH
jgi:hypothetical protein